MNINTAICGRCGMRRDTAEPHRCAKVPAALGAPYGRAASAIDPSWTDGSHMRTVSGRRFNLLDPRAEDVTLDDISYALSRLARFNGHTQTLTPYSVAEHSVRVAVLLPAPLQLLGLLHDAHEAYTGDISTPMARAICTEAGVSYNPIRRIKQRIQSVIYVALGVEAPTLSDETAIKLADEQALEQEMELYLRDPELAPRTVWTPAVAELRFRQHYRTLQAGR